MPNIKSAKKRDRTSIEARERNMSMRSRVRTARSKFRDALEAKDAAQGATAYRSYCSVLDRAAKQGVLERNTAQRRKTRAANSLRKLA